MVLDQNSTIALEGVIDFPEWIFGNQPVQPSAIKDTNTLAGSSAGTSQSIGGSVSQTGPTIPQPPFPGS